MSCRGLRVVNIFVRLAAMVILKLKSRSLQLERRVLPLLTALPSSLSLSRSLCPNGVPFILACPALAGLRRERWHDPSRTQSARGS